jgi:hypothetical protein
MAREDYTENNLTVLWRSMSFVAICVLVPDQVFVFLDQLSVQRGLTDPLRLNSRQHWGGFLTR